MSEHIGYFGRQRINRSFLVSYDVFTRSEWEDNYKLETMEPVRRVWIPQTIADCIWVVYEFKSIKRKRQAKAFVRGTLGLNARDIDKEFADQWLHADMIGRGNTRQPYKRMTLTFQCPIETKSVAFLSEDGSILQTLHIPEKCFEVFS